MTYDTTRPNDAPMVERPGETARIAQIAPAPADLEKIVEARSRLLGEGQERGWAEDDDEVRQSS